MELDFYQKVILAAYASSREDSRCVYRFQTCQDGTMVITPLLDMDGGNLRELKDVHVNDGRIFGDESVVNTLEEKLRELFS